MLSFEEFSDDLELLAVMGREFAASLDIEETLKMGLDLIARYVGAEGGALFLLNETGDKLRCKAAVGPVDITGLELGSRDGIVGHCVTSNEPSIVRDAQKDPNFKQDVDKSTGFVTRSILCAPMSVKSQRIGAVELVNKNSGDGLFSPDDLNLLQALSTAAAMAILNARMAEALVEQERMKRELELAAEIQRSLLPPSGGPGFPVFGLNHPARTVSGDFFDFFTLPDGRIVFNVADVSGKGMNAAILMAKTASLFRCLGKEIFEPGRLLCRINDEVLETVTRGMFVTMAAGIYDPATGRVRLANAGHEPPLFLTADGVLRDFPAGAPPLGVMPMQAGAGGCEEVEFSLDGGSLYIFTDGITEGYLSDGSELGSDGFKQAIANRDTDTAPAARVTALVARLLESKRALRDDLTVLTIDDALGRAQARNENNASDKSCATTGEGAEDDGNGEKNLFSLRIAAQADRLKLIREAVRQASICGGCCEDIAQDIVLAVDEACQNVIRHAYQEAQGGDIELTISRQQGTLVISIRDFADPVDPSTIRPRDLDDVRPGGLGTHFINEVMDSVEYLRPESGRGNLLRLKKEIA